jgi:hypothetical protein
MEHGVSRFGNGVALGVNGDGSKRSALNFHALGVVCANAVNRLRRPVPYRNVIPLVIDGVTE